MKKRSRLLRISLAILLCITYISGCTKKEEGNIDHTIENEIGIVKEEESGKQESDQDGKETLVDAEALYKEISLEDEFVLDYETLVTIYEIPRVKREVEEGKGYGMVDAIATDKGVFYFLEYTWDMAQYASGYDIGYWNPDTKEHSILYSCGEGTEREMVNWINEVSGNEEYLVWMEQCPSETNGVWEMRCMDLDTFTIETLHSISWDARFELCPVVSKDYVAWYEPVNEAGEIGIFLYSFENKEIKRIGVDERIIWEHPYSRVSVTQDTCTYAAERSGIRQIVEENVVTGEKKAFTVPDQTMGILFPVANDKVIIWRDRYDTDWGIYLYHKEKEQLYYFPEPEGGTIFSDYLADNTLYIHVQEANMGSRILTVNVESLDIQVLIEAEKDKDFLLITNSGKYCSVYTYMDINKNNYVYVWE